MESGAPHPRSPRVRSVGATITSVSRNLVSAGALICTEVGADDQICGLPATNGLPSKAPSTQGGFAAMHRRRGCEPNRVPDTAYNSS